MFEFTEEEFFEFHQRVASNVKKFRQSKSVTQLDLAIEMGMKNSSFISNVENPKLQIHHYSIEHLYKIASILEVNICEFLK
ncbi:MAG: helix-turn-helix domain-containing protein [Epsilonproteobacteria bacterium]|nr:helix-turn-helix domain-containing protein [Campylobacterota bacterium]